MTPLQDLERYLATARVVEIAAFPWGGAHPDKCLAILEGGAALLCKPAPPSNSDAAWMIRCEAAAWALVQALGWDELVPATILRRITLDPHGALDVSLQLVWPTFQTAAQLGVQAATCTDDHRWRAALVDVLIRNTDRNDSNWGFLQGSSAVRLVDHGYAFLDWPGRAPQSPFVESLRETPIPAQHLAPLTRWLSQPDPRLAALVGAAAANLVAARAHALLAQPVLSWV